MADESITVDRSYVDNYFTNLDVQQEINNKLDRFYDETPL